MAYSTRPLIDRIMGGVLDDKLAEWQAEGISPERMAARLWADYGVNVSYRTLYRWLADEPTEAAS